MVPDVRKHSVTAGIIIIITIVTVSTSYLVCKHQSHDIPFKSCTDKITISFSFYKNCHSLKLSEFQFTFICTDISIHLCDGQKKCT